MVKRYSQICLALFASTHDISLAIANTKTKTVDGGLLYLFKYLLLGPWLDFDVEINRS